MNDKIRKSDADWQQKLTPEQYAVCRCHGTEPPFSGKYAHTKDPGIYMCVCCGQELFDSQTKYDSGSGWPSFTAPRTAAVDTSVDRSLLMTRTEVHCARCGGHLGHVFPDGPAPTQQRYCMNGAALTFDPAKKA